MNFVQEQIGDTNTSLGLLIIIGVAVVFFIILYLKGRK